MATDEIFSLSLLSEYKAQKKKILVKVRRQSTETEIY